MTELVCKHGYRPGHCGRSDCTNDVIADLRAENARLQARMDGALDQVERLINTKENVIFQRDRALEERDRYKARDKLRGEALRANAPKCGEEDCGNVGVWMWWDSTDTWHMCDDHKSSDMAQDRLLEGPELDYDAMLARAAIAAPPDEEK